MRPSTRQMTMKSQVTMTDNRRDLLVCYDISGPRRLRRVHRLMRKWGMPLQYSVFYCRLSDRERRRLEYALEGLIEISKDDVRVYRIRGFYAIEYRGVGSLPENIDYYLTG